MGSGAASWQNATRAAVSMEPAELRAAVGAFFSAIFFVIVWAIFRGLAFLLRHVVR